MALSNISNAEIKLLSSVDWERFDSEH